MKRPNAILHMTIYGLVYGWLLGMLFIWLIIFDGTTALNMDWRRIVILIVVTGVFSLIFGGLLGSILGYFGGRVLRFLTWHIVSPLSHDLYIETRNLSLVIMGGLTFLGTTGLLALFSGLPSLNNIFSWMIFMALQGLINGGAAAYAVNRYMLKLRKWANIGKAKNDYKSKNQLAYDDTLQNELLTAESESQRDSLTS